MHLHTTHFPKVPNALITLSLIIIGFALVLTGFLPLQFLGGGLLLLALILPSLRLSPDPTQPVRQQGETRTERDWSESTWSGTPGEMRTAPVGTRISGGGERAKEGGPITPVFPEVVSRVVVGKAGETFGEETVPPGIVLQEIELTDPAGTPLFKGVLTRAAADELAKELLRNSEQGGEIIIHEQQRSFDVSLGTTASDVDEMDPESRSSDDTGQTRQRGPRRSH